MSGQKVGYIRVSSEGQNEGRQLEGLTLGRVFTDKVSGATRERPELAALLAYVRAGDEVFCHSMDRLARNLDDLRGLVRDLTGRGVRVHFVKEGLTFSGDDAPMARLLLSMMGAFAEFERSLIKERQREGVALAKKAGKYKGRACSLSPEKLAELREDAARGLSKSALGRKYGVSRGSVYNYLGEEG